MLLRSLYRKPNPVQKEQCKEDKYREPEVQLQQSRIVDVRDHGDNDADASQEPQEPALV